MGKSKGQGNRKRNLPKKIRLIRRKIDRIKRFSIHVLRHTYATRAIERGVQPKVLQKLLGYASIQTIMGGYVHVTNESLSIAIKQFEGAALP